MRDRAARLALVGTQTARREMESSQLQSRFRHSRSESFQFNEETTFSRKTFCISADEKAPPEGIFPAVSLLSMECFPLFTKHGGGDF